MNNEEKKLIEVAFPLKQTSLDSVQTFSRQGMELKVTEGFIMQNPEESIDLLQKFSELGIRLSIDDFGTGHSSLAYLKKLPIHKLKIDRSFVRNINTNQDDAAIANAIITLARQLHLDIIAEGVEYEAQKDYLQQCGCLEIQGYLYGKPMLASQIEKLFSQKIILPEVSK